MAVVMKGVEHSAKTAEGKKRMQGNPRNPRIPGIRGRGKLGSEAVGKFAGEDNAVAPLVVRVSQYGSRKRLESRASDGLAQNGACGRPVDGGEFGEYSMCQSGAICAGGLGLSD